jgi:hypothetical protein
MVARLLIALLLGSLATGCERKPPPPAKPVSAGSVRIVVLKPDTTTPLKVGAKVKLQAEIAYRLLADAGVLTLVVQLNDKGLAQASQAIQRGEGKATLAVEFVVPEAKAIQVYTPLQALGQKTTATVDARTYKIVVK